MRHVKLANAFIVLFLGYQVAMPLTYYLSDRVYDERFSWRMFSSVRLTECKVSVTETKSAGGKVQHVDLEHDLQIAWVNVLERLRPAVIQKYFERRCAQTGSDAIEKVELLGTCSGTDGKPLPARRFSMLCRGADASEVHEEAVQ